MLDGTRGSLHIYFPQAHYPVCIFAAGAAGSAHNAQTVWEGRSPAWVSKARPQGDALCECRWFPPSRPPEGAQHPQQQVHLHEDDAR